MIFVHYITFCSFFVFAVAWVMIRAFREKQAPPGGDDGFGGTDNTGLPVVDLPPGARLSDWLTDRVSSPDRRQRPIRLS